jgi:diguanylate cyclase (GGDEF)-like protein/PAS domain S-box-containing protein
VATRSPQKGAVAKKTAAASRLTREQHAVPPDLLRDIATQVAGNGEPEFFPSLARYLARKLSVNVAYVAEITGGGSEKARTVSLCVDGKIVPNLQRALRHSACAHMVGCGLYIAASGVRKEFPQDELLARQQAEGYAGIPLYGASGEPIGAIVVLSREPLVDTVTVEALLRVLSARTAAELERRRSQERAPRLNRLLRTMREINKMIVRVTEEAYVFGETCRMLVEHGGFHAVWIGQVQATGEIEPVAQTGISDDDYLERVRFRYDEGTDGQSPTVTAVLTGQCAVQADLESEGDVPWAAGARVLGCRSCAAFPLYKAGRVVGTITLYAAETRAFDPAETDLLDDLAGDVSHAMQSLEEAALRRRAEGALRESQRMFATLVSNLPGMVYRCRNDKNWTMEFVSDGAFALTGYAATDFVENRVRAYADIIDAGDRESVWRDTQAALAARAAFQGVYSIRTADGTQKWVWEHGRGVYAPDGELVCLEGFVTDITARKQAEDALAQSEERFRGLTELSSDWFWEQDAEFRFTMLTHNVGAGTRPPIGDTLGRRRWELPYYGGSAGVDWEAHKQLLEAHRPFKDFVVQWRTPEGDVRYNCVSGVPIFDPDGSFKGYRGTGRDITDRMRAEEEMRKLSSAIQQTADCVMITDRDGVIEYVNAAFEQVTGYARSEILGRHPSVLKSGLHDADFYQQVWRQILAGETFRDVFINRKHDGEMYYEEKTISPLRNPSGEITHFISTGKDITERMQAQERLHYLAHHDALTDLPNRVLFLDRLNHALARAQWHQRVVAVMFLDFDRFKNINDTLGHDVGDALLKVIAERLQQRVREGDSVARLGGDEFAVLLEDIAHVEDVSALATKLLDAFGQPFIVQSHELYITASIGISLFPSDGENAAALLKNADTAMYRAKDVGKNNYQFYSAEMSAAAFERLRLETNLRHALERDEFVLHYQPQIELTTGRVIGVEALIRWQPPEFGLLAPAHFVGVAEETGAIVQVGEWALRTAMAQGKLWRDAGHTGLRMAINVSARQFHEPGFVEMVARVLRETGLPPDALELEITESVIMENAERMIERLRALNNMGVQFSIDDFGTGYSSLSYLRRFPIQTLKIDQSFIHDLSEDGGDAEIVKTIITMARGLKLAVIAEGVETREQLTFLQAHGCNAAQGYFLSRPLSVERFNESMSSGELHRLLRT